jgi:drug/metabolite transporter (DMT)-like permease
MKYTMERSLGIAALLTVTLVWGTTFPAVKELTADFSSLWIVLLRFSLAALLLSPWLRRVSRSELAYGVSLGVPLFCSFLFQIEGLALSNANRNAFVYGLNALMVPLLGLATGQSLGRNVALGMLLAVSGVACLCWEDGAWGRGDNLALLGALAFALYIKLMERGTVTGNRLMPMTAVQIWTVAVCSAICLWWHEAFGLELGVNVATAATWEQIAAAVKKHAVNLAYLGALATAAIIALQTWGQRRTSANEAASIYALEPAAAAIFSAVWLGESLTGRACIGAVLLFVGMIVCQWQSTRSNLAAV